jgi:glycosyltransferase involved in cell wall biosynthesis
MQPISATIITCNEEDRIEDALRSLDWVDEIVVVDSGSVDATLEICREYTGKIFHRNWSGFVDQKNYAVAKASNDWILSLDADERVSPELRKEIEEISKAGFQGNGYRIPRVAFFLGRWIRHGDWHPDYQMRLFDRRYGIWQGGRVHESVKVNGPADVLKGKMYHYTYRDLADYLRKLDTYSSLAALDYRDRGRRATPIALISKPLGVFFKAYLLKRGFLDGAAGLTVASMGAVSAFFKYAKLYEMKRESGEKLDAR